MKLLRDGVGVGVGFHDQTALFYRGGRHQLHPCALEVVKPFEIAGVLGAHLQYGATLALVFGGSAQMMQHGLQAFPIGEQGWLFAPDLALDIAENPRVADGGPADHDSVHSVAFSVKDGFLGGVDVTVADNGDGHARVGLHGSDEAPVGLPAIHLGARAPVNGDGLYANVLQPLRHFHDGPARLVPAQARLDRDGQIDSLDHRSSERHHLGDVLQYGRSRALAHDLADGAAPVDVDEVGLALGGNLRGCNQGAFVVTENLYPEGPLFLVELHLFQALIYLPRQRVGGDELGDEHVRAVLLADHPESMIRDALHGG